MPTQEELEAQRVKNREIAKTVTGAAGKALGQPDRPGVQELPEEEASKKWEGYQYELSDEERARRMGERMTPEQQPIEGIIQRMAENYNTSPQYRQLLDQELAQISAQISELTQRRNMIEMAKRGMA